MRRAGARRTRRRPASSGSSTSSPSSSRCNELADAGPGGAGPEVGIDVRVEHLENPRVEAEEHYYNATHTKLLDLGLQPHLLLETLIESMFAAIERYRDRVVPDHILPADALAGGSASAPSS